MKLLLWSMLLLGVVFIGGVIYVGVVPHTQVEREALVGVWATGIAAALVVWLVAAFGFRRSAYRERAAGYTTIYGDTADIVLPRVSIPMFSTIDLWQLDEKTGAVIRRPGERG